MEDANGRAIKIGDVVTISRHHKSGESRPEQAVVIRAFALARVVIKNGPDAGHEAIVGSRNVWLTPSGK